MKEIIKVEHLCRNFTVGNETVHALRDVSFTINEGEFVTIMGTSGSGKSTLLNILGCLDTPTSGEYLIDGTSVRKMGKNDRAMIRNRKIGFVFQNYNLLPKTTALENVELPLFYNPAISSKERRQPNVGRAAATCGNSPRAGQRPGSHTCRRSYRQLGHTDIIQHTDAFPRIAQPRTHDNLRHPQSRTVVIQQPQHSAARRQNHFR